MRRVADSLDATDAWRGGEVRSDAAEQGMNLTKRGQLRSFAAYPQCWADLTSRLAGVSRA